MSSPYHFHNSPNNSAMLGYYVTKFQTVTIFTNQVMCCQVHAIGKAIRPRFAEPVTFLL